MPISPACGSLTSTRMPRSRLPGALYVQLSVDAVDTQPAHDGAVENVLAVLWQLAVATVAGDRSSSEISSARGTTRYIVSSPASAGTSSNDVRISTVTSAGRASPSSISAASGSAMSRSLKSSSIIAIAETRPMIFWELLGVCVSIDTPLGEMGPVGSRPMGGLRQAADTASAAGLLDRPPEIEQHSE